MNAWRLLCASAGVSAVVFASSAAPAHAVDYTVTEPCGGHATLDIELAVGDTYTVINGGCLQASAFNGSGPAPRTAGIVTINGTPLIRGTGNQTFPNPGSLVYSATSAGSTTIQTAGSGGGVVRNFTVIGMPGIEEAPAPAGPVDIVQQIEPTTAGCSAVNRPDLNWSGVSSGGWGASWAQWANHGAGGAVCTRTLTYANGAWKVIAA